MKKIGCLLIITLACTQIFSQGKVRNDMDPAVTEVWEPIPRIISFSNNVPSDALVLFDGSNLDQWETEKGNVAAWDIKEGFMTVKPGSGSIQTKESFGDCQLHLEWKSPDVVKGTGQGRGNSGVFLMGKYEVQVLDNYDNRTYSNGQAGSLYKQTMPLVNACKPPGEWQTYDIIFKAPRFNNEGRKISDAAVTVLHNGVVTQNNTTIWGTTEYKGLPSNNPHGPAPLGLQDHGDLVSYRNIWIRRL